MLRFGLLLHARSGFTSQSEGSIFHVYFKWFWGSIIRYTYFEQQHNLTSDLEKNNKKTSTKVCEEYYSNNKIYQFFGNPNHEKDII